MHIERGSTWNRWDFHVHTPYSILNNGFGFDPDPEWKTDVAEFDNYVRTLFTKAVEKNIRHVAKAIDNKIVAKREEERSR